MYINVDASGLEVNGVAYLSQDQVLMDEIISRADIHSNNQARFKLPTGDLGRLIAKIFVFRLVYGGSAYSYANDPDFTAVSSSEKYWQKVIDEFYSKYQGIHAWHTKILQEVTVNKRLIMPTGRTYDFEPKVNYRGELKWPETTIKNYPVQGLGADLMNIVRVDFANRFWNSGMEGKLRSTVHDSIVVDAPKKNVDNIVQMMYDTFTDVPKNFKKVFGVEYNLPLFCECKVGSDLKNLEKVKHG
jgi:DNA polymerase I-like protein with 3'-5' exonuclease and polymerase domains